MLKIYKIYFMLALMFFNVKILAQFNNSDNQFRLAKMYEAQGDFDKAKEIYQKLYNQQPSNIDYYFSLNDLYLKLKDYDSSIELINNRIKKDEKNITLYGDLGSVYFTKGDENKALQIWNDAIKIDPNNPFTYKIISNYLIENRAIDKAIEILKEGSKLSEDKTVFTYDIANLYSITMQFDKATQEYCELIKSDPKHLSIVKNRIYAYLNTNEANDVTLETVKKYYEQYNDVSYLELLSELYLRTENFRKAYNSTKELEELTSKNGSKLFNFAINVSRMGLHDLASEAYKQILNNYKQSSLYAQAEIGFTKNLEESITNKINTDNDWKPLKLKTFVDNDAIYDLIKSYTELVKKYPENKIGWEAEYRVGLLYLHQLNNILKADSVFQKIIEEKRSIEFIVPTYYELGYLNIQKDNLIKAQNYFDIVLSNKRSNPDLLIKTKYLNAKCKMWQGKFSNAIILLNEVKDDLKDKYANDALELLLLLNTMKNDSLNLLLYSNADYLLEQNKYYEAAKEFEKISNKESLFILKNIAELKYSQILIALNNYEDAIILINKSLESDAVNIFKDRMFYLLGASYFYGLHDNDAALKYLTQFIDLFNNSIYFGKAVNIISEIRSRENNSI